MADYRRIVAAGRSAVIRITYRRLLWRDMWRWEIGNIEGFGYYSPGPSGWQPSQEKATQAAVRWVEDWVHHRGAAGKARAVSDEIKWEERKMTGGGHG